MLLNNFIVFEGIDGSGTTTQINNMIKYCEKRNVKAISTMEPTNSSIGLIIRSFLAKRESFFDETIIRLFATDRCEHIYGKNGILQYINNDFLVFSDRYLFSSLAYQGFGKLKDLVLRENNDFPLPSTLFFFDLPLEKAIMRIEERNRTKEIYENIDFLSKVRENYISIIDFYKEAEPNMNIVLLDATKDEKLISQDIIEMLEKFKILK